MESSIIGGQLELRTAGKRFVTTYAEICKLTAVSRPVDITGPMANNVFVEPEELKTLRTQLKLTQAQLAKKLKVDVATISRWERGTRKIQNPEEMALRAIEKESR